MIPAAITLLVGAVLGVLAWHGGGNDQPATRLAGGALAGLAALLTAWGLPRHCRLPPLAWAWCIAVPVVAVAVVQALPLGVTHPWAADATTTLGTGTGAWSVEPQLTWRAAAWAAAVVLVAALAAILARGDRAWLLARWIIAAAATHVAVALVLAVTVPGSQELYGSRLHGTFIYPNHAASFWGAGCVLALLVARRGEDQWPWFAMALLALGVVFTASRAGIVITALVCLPLAWRSLPERGRPWYALALGTALAGYLALVGVGDTRDRFDRLVDGDGFSAEGLSISGRLDMWSAAVPLAAEAGALGSGGGTAERVFPRAGNRSTATMRVDHLHSDPLEWWLEYGWAGSALALAGLAAAAWLLRRRSALPDQLQAVRTGALAGLAILALHGCTDLIWHSPAIVLLAALLTGILAATTTDPELAAVRRTRPARWTLAATGLLVLGSTLALMPWALADGRAAAATVYLVQRLAAGQAPAPGSDCVALMGERPAATPAVALLQARTALALQPPDPAVAGEALARCAVLAPALGGAWIERARLAALRREPAAALAAAERALAWDPASPYVQQHAVLCLDRSMHADRRRALVARLLDGDQRQPAWFFTLAAEDLGAASVTAAVLANRSTALVASALPWLEIHAAGEAWLTARGRVAATGMPVVAASQWLPAAEIAGTGVRIHLPREADQRAELAERLDAAGLPLSADLRAALAEDGEPWSLWTGSTALDDAAARERWRSVLSGQRWRSWAVRRLELIAAAERAAGGDTSAVTSSSDPRLAEIAFAAPASSHADRVRMDLLRVRFRTPAWQPLDQGRWTWLLAGPGTQATVSISRWSGLVVDGAWRGWRRGTVDVAEGLTPGMHRVALIAAP